MPSSSFIVSSSISPQSVSYTISTKLDRVTNPIRVLPSVSTIGTFLTLRFKIVRTVSCNLLSTLTR